jgi:hypothetical protein
LRSNHLNRSGLHQAEADFPSKTTALKQEKRKSARNNYSLSTRHYWRFMLRAWAR